MMFASATFVQNLKALNYPCIQIIFGTRGESGLITASVELRPSEARAFAAQIIAACDQAEPRTSESDIQEGRI